MKKYCIEYLHWIIKHKLKAIALLGWVSLVVTFFSFKYHYNLSFIDILKHWYYFFSQYYYGPLFMIIFYVFRQFIFFPVWLLAIICWALYGPFLWFIVVFIGENLSAQIGYMLGRFFGKNILDHQEIIEINLFKKKFAVNLLFAVFLSKIVYIPDDIVNIGRWYLRVPRKKYITGTIAGNILFMVLNVMIGSGIQNIEAFDLHQLEFQRPIIILSFIASLVLAIVWWRIIQYIHKK